jgi:hypothetical protein
MAPAGFQVTLVTRKRKYVPTLTSRGYPALIDGESKQRASIPRDVSLLLSAGRAAAATVIRPVGSPYSTGACSGSLR